MIVDNLNTENMEIMLSDFFTLLSGLVDVGSLLKNVAIKSEFIFLCQTLELNPYCQHPNS